MDSWLFNLGLTAVLGFPFLAIKTNPSSASEVVHYTTIIAASCLGMGYAFLLGYWIGQNVPPGETFQGYTVTEALRMGLWIAAFELVAVPVFARFIGTK